MRQLGSGVDGFDLLVADKNLYFKMISIKVSSHLTLIGSEILIVYKRDDPYCIVIKSMVRKVHAIL